MINSLSDIRIGNVVEYNGPIGSYRYIPVAEVDGAGNPNRFTFKKPYSDESFVSSPDYIRRIFLTRRHLDILGFQFDAQRRRYSLNGLTVAFFSAIAGDDPMNADLITLGFKILTQDLPTLPTERQIEELTTDVPYLHTLQNYCSDNGINDIDFSLIRY